MNTIRFGLIALLGAVSVISQASVIDFGELKSYDRVVQTRLIAMRDSVKPGSFGVKNPDLPAISNVRKLNGEFLLQQICWDPNTGRADEFEFPVRHSHIKSTSPDLTGARPLAVCGWIKVQSDRFEFVYGVREFNGQYYRAQRQLKSAMLDFHVDESDPRRLHLHFKDGRRGVLQIPDDEGEILSFELKVHRLEITLTSRIRSTYHFEVTPTEIKVQPQRTSGESLSLREIAAKYVPHEGCRASLSNSASK